MGEISNTYKIVEKPEGRRQFGRLRHRRRCEDNTKMNL
jgi:hypothetical protein